MIREGGVERRRAEGIVRETGNGRELEKGFFSRKREATSNKRRGGKKKRAREEEKDREEEEAMMK